MVSKYIDWLTFGGHTSACVSSMTRSLKETPSPGKRVPMTFVFADCSVPGAVTSPPCSDSSPGGQSGPGARLPAQVRKLTGRPLFPRDCGQHCTSRSFCFHDVVLLLPTSTALQLRKQQSPPCPFLNVTFCPPGVAGPPCPEYPAALPASPVLIKCSDGSRAGDVCLTSRSCLAFSSPIATPHDEVSLRADNMV